ncbi:hypothetical protein N7491_011009 [Penicillium cf. griseofulvum]|uniref:CRAL-TRIO domain-containing protein n=1 Tax=Penicillium cf. griseofulvum TaxID=2972120 RepID=A0A9W9T6D6_9EURO|nr:hypothetical protein N7472_001328 [Penicillium cf. griseofulvum]KAJ5422564.1 hypothetical protein N7491_011009 [Penicillium cf. griseofulvum]KAJ5428741.1 hypothetical protein N7445_010195 [Penicillium cf. griseofulvum]
MEVTQPNIGIPPEHEATFRAFTQYAQEKGLLTRPDSLESRDLCDGLSDPPTLLRFLVARQFDPDGALKQFEETYKFREEKDILRLYDLVDIANFDQARQIYPHWIGRRDKNGLPICMLDLDRLDKYALTRWETTRKNSRWMYSQSGKVEPPNPDMLQLASVYHDYLIRFILPLCSMMTDRPNPSVPVSNSIYVVDASNLGLKQAWGLRFFAQEISWLLSTCYPETIQRVFVCNAPSYYSTVWKYLKGWVDPYTAEKIVVLLDAEVLPTLREYIDDANIPTKFGGKFQFTHGMPPDLDGNIQQLLKLDSSKSLPPGPLKWIQDSDGRRTALAVGSKAGSERSVKIATVD